MATVARFSLLNHGPDPRWPNLLCMEMLMRSESEEANSKVQREKDVFFSAGQNTTFLAGTSRTVCPLWQYPACLDVHKRVFTCNSV